LNIPEQEKLKDENLSAYHYEFDLEKK